MKQARPPYREPQSPVLRDRDALMRRDRVVGMTIRAIAARYGLSPSHVYRIVGDVSVLIARPPRPRKSRQRQNERWERYFELKSRARELRKRGYSYREIATALGISPGCVYKAARMTRITSLEGRAWLSHREGRPPAWKRALRKGIDNGRASG